MFVAGAWSVSKLKVVNVGEVVVNRTCIMPWREGLRRQRSSTWVRDVMLVTRICLGDITVGICCGGPGLGAMSLAVRRSLERVRIGRRIGREVVVCIWRGRF